jgi:hypothetical protein
MKSFLVGIYAILFLASITFLFISCKKKNEQEPLVITPTVNPISHSAVAYFITPTDKTFNPDFYRAARIAIVELQGWYKKQMGNNKTFILNPVILDTLTALHNSNWFNNNNSGDSIFYNNSTAYGYYNTKHELKQLLGSKFDTAQYVYFVFIPAPFGDETVPRGLAAEGLENLEGLTSSDPNRWRGYAGHAFGHAFGLPEPAVPSKDGIMSEGSSNYPNCVLKSYEKDSLNASPYFIVQ